MTSGGPSSTPSVRAADSHHADVSEGCDRPHAAGQRPRELGMDPGRLRSCLARAGRPAPDRGDRGPVGAGVGHRAVRVHRAGRAQPRHGATRACGARRSSTASTACSRWRPAAGRRAATTSPTSPSSPARPGGSIDRPAHRRRPRARGVPRRSPTQHLGERPVTAVIYTHSHARPLRRRARRHHARPTSTPAAAGSSPPSTSCARPSPRT